MSCLRMLHGSIHALQICVITALSALQSCSVALWSCVYESPLQFLRFPLLLPLVELSLRHWIVCLMPVSTGILSLRSCQLLCQQSADGGVYHFCAACHVSARTH